MIEYELSMTTDYVKHWGEWEAVREILQNAIDHGNPIIRQGFGKLEIVSEGVTLDPSTLLLGSTTKLDDKNSIGQFGEGYKLACLVLARMGKKVGIHNGDKIWVPVIKHVEKYNTKILVIEEFEGNPDNKDLIFEINDIDIDLKGKYLADHKENKILKNEYGKIYVAGLYVCQLAGFKHGYNFSASTIELGRDRNMLSSWDVKYQTAKLWNNANKPNQVFKMLEEKKPDVEYMDTNHYSSQAGIAGVYLRKYGNVIPVTTQEDIEACGGQAYRVVPQCLKKIVRAAYNFILKPFSTPMKRLERWTKRWGGSMPTEAKKELESIIKQMGGGKENETET